MQSPYLKAIVNTVLAAAGVLVTALGTGSTTTFSNIDAKHWLLAAAAVLGSGALTWWCQNGPWHEYIKAVVAFLSAGIGSVILALNDNVITQAEWITALTVAVTAAAAVFQVTNAGAKVAHK